METAGVTPEPVAGRSACSRAAIRAVSEVAVLGMGAASVAEPAGELDDSVASEMAGVATEVAVVAAVATAGVAEAAVEVADETDIRRPGQRVGGEMAAKREQENRAEATRAAEGRAGRVSFAHFAV